MGDSSVLILCNTDHSVRRRCQQVLGLFAAQKAVACTEPVSHTLAVLVPLENLDDFGQRLQRPVACIRGQTVTGKIVDPTMIDSEDLTLLFPLVGLGAVFRLLDCATCAISAAVSQSPLSAPPIRLGYRGSRSRICRSSGHPSPSSRKSMHEFSTSPSPSRRSLWSRDHSQNAYLYRW